MFITDISYPLLCQWSNLKQVFLFPKGPWTKFIQSLYKHQNKVEHAFIYNFSCKMADHSKIHFLSQTRNNFPLFVHQPPKIKFIFAYFLLYPIKKNFFSLWFWDAHRFLRSEHSPYCNRLLDESLFLSNQTYNNLKENTQICLITSIKNKNKAF